MEISPLGIKVQNLKIAYPMLDTIEDTQTVDIFVDGTWKVLDVDPDLKNKDDFLWIIQQNKQWGENPLLRSDEILFGPKFVAIVDISPSKKEINQLATFLNKNLAKKTTWNTSTVGHVTLIPKSYWDYLLD